MSGDIFKPNEMGSSQLEDPLLCYICRQTYNQPCILPCFHSFCTPCVRESQKNGIIKCALCGIMLHVKDTDGYPSSDEVLNFLLGSQCDDDATPCANCDVLQTPMSFCETCNQALCAVCKETTHQARMFQSHKITPYSQSLKRRRLQCPTHHEPYVLYTRQEKSMLCLHCFRDLPVEKRAFCVDIDTAYHEACNKLDRVVQAMRERQTSVEAGIAQLQALLGDIRINAELEKEAIECLYDNLVEKLRQKKDGLLAECDRQFQEKESVFERQLQKHSCLLPTLHTNLSIGTAFSTSANKYEFLLLYHVLISRLRAVTKLDQPLVSSHSSTITSDYKTHFARCLDAVLYPFNTVKHKQSPLPRPRSNSNGKVVSNTRLDVGDPVQNATPAMSFVPVCGRRASGMAVTVRFIDSKSVFAQHCLLFRETHGELVSKAERLKILVQEVYRDLTMRRVYANSSLVASCQSDTDTVRSLLAEHSSQLLLQQTALQKHWEDSLERISNEQELYQAQMNDVERVKKECDHLVNIVAQLSSFASTINSVTDRVLPHLGETCDSRGGQYQTLMDSINMINPDSKQRVDAIEALQEERLQMTANRTNPLDGELIKQKGLLKAPGERPSRVQKDTRTHTSGAEEDNVVSQSLQEAKP